jgi:hypothetical protein
MAHLDSGLAGNAFAAAIFTLVSLAGCDDEDHTAQPEDAGGAPHYGFDVYLEGSTIMLETPHPESRWYMTCSNAFTFIKVIGDATAPLIDARKDMGANGYYLDGKFVPHGEAMTCDQKDCSSFDAKQPIGRAVEYLQTGKKPPPVGSSAPPEVPVIETRPVSTSLGITVKYSKTGRCDRVEEASLLLTVPQGALPDDDAGI